MYTFVVKRHDLLVLAAILLTGIYYLLGPDSLLSTISKMAPAALLALWVFIAAERSRYSKGIVLGLITGALADAVIISAFLPGLVLFLLAHIAYIAVFVMDSRRPAVQSLAVSSVFAGVLFAVIVVLGDSGGMELPILAYSLVIAAMWWRAFARAGEAHIPRASAIAGIVGATLFMISDSVLAVGSFVSAIPGQSFIVMPLYWLAQAGFAVSALQHEESTPRTARENCL